MTTENWDHEVDVLIVGSGNGGMTAAVCAYEMGLKNALVIEKSDKFGGTSAVSGGGIWIPWSHYARDAGVKDSLDDAREYLRQTIPETSVDPAMLDTYVKAGPEMLKFLHDRTRVRYEVLAHYPDYYTNLPGAKDGYRSHEPAAVDITELGEEEQHLQPGHQMMRFLDRITLGQVEAQIMLVQANGWKSIVGRLLWDYITDIPRRFRTTLHRRLMCGTAGIARLRLSMMDRNLPLWRNTRLIELIHENGRVTGAVVNREGKRLRIKAARGVVLAAGGFEQNQEMREKYLPKPTNTAWTAGVPANTGDAINAGLLIGARFRLVDGAWWCTNMLVPGEPFPRLAIMEKSCPGAVTVNTTGKRVANESQNYMAYMKEAFARHSPAQPSSPLYMVFDADFRKRYLVGPLMKSAFRPDFTFPKSWYEQGFLAKADTIEDLARQMKIDAEGLKDTVAKMNTYAQTGKDPEFGRGDSAYDRYYGDPTVKPNPCLGPIAKAPFYAVRMELGDFGTHGGLDIDTNAQVLNESGRPMPGLYAIGNSAAAILPTYPGPGSTLGPAMTFGYLAAKHMSGMN